MCPALNVHTDTSRRPTTSATVTNTTQLATTGRALPNVTAVMKAAQETYTVVTQDRSKLQAQVAEQQRAAKKLLTEHKSQYEATIRHQVKVNQDEWDNYQMMRSKLKASDERVAQLRSQIQAVNDSSNIIRAAMSQLVPKVKVAKDFLDQIDNEVAALEPSEMEAIRPTTPEPTLAYYLGKERSQAGLATSLLQLGSKQGAVKAEEVSKRLQKDDLPAAMLDTLSRLDQANQHAEDMLLSRFKVVLEEKTQRHMRLLNDTQRLNETLVASDATEAALITAKGHLDGVNTNLRNRLQGINTFYRQVGAAMTRTLEEAEAASSTVHA